MRGGLVPGEEQEHAGRNELVLRQALAAFVEGHELGQEIALRRCASRAHELAEDIRHLAGRRGGSLVLLWHIARATDEERHLVGQPLKAPELVSRDAEHVHDHQRGQRPGELGDEVELSTLANRVEQPLRQ